MRRQWEDDLIAVAILGLTDKVQKSVIEGNDYSAGCAMGFGLALLKLQQFVRVIDVGIGEIFNIAPTESAVEAEDKGAVNVGILLFVMRIGEQNDFFLTEDFFFELAVVFLDRDTSARILCNYVLVERGKYHFLEAPLNRVSAFAGEAVDEILSERLHQVFGQLLRLYFQTGCLFLPFGCLLRIILLDDLLFFLCHIAFDFFRQQFHLGVNKEIDEHSRLSENPLKFNEFQGIL